MLRRIIILLLAGLPSCQPAFAQTNFVVDETSTTTVAEDRVGPARMTTNKILYAQPANGSGTALFPNAFASADAIAAQTATFLHGGLMGWNGTGWDRLQVDGSKNLKVVVQNASLAVTGTFWQATQPISAASLPLPTGASTSAKQPALGTAGTASADVLTVQGITAMTPLKTDGSGVTQPVSGTVSITANSAVNVNQVGGSAVTTLAAGEQKVGVEGLAASGAAKSGNPVQMGGVFNTTQPTVTTGQAVEAQMTSRGAQIVAAGVDGFTVTANAGTNLNTSALALSATQTDGTQKSIVRGGAKGSTSATDLTGTASGANHQALDVAIYDGSGNQITSFGGGTQYTEDAASVADPVGNALLARRRDTLSTETSTDGDVTALNSTGKGELYVKHTDSVTVTQGTGTSLHMVCDSGCTPGGSTADNSSFSFSTTSLNPAGYVFDDVSPNAVTENNVATPRMSGNRVPYGILRDAAGNERGANVNASNQLSVSVDNTVTVASHAVTNAGTFATQSAQSGTWTVQPGNTANTTPWLVKPHDGTNAGTIKAASTAAGATDTALVVAVSPNNTVAVTQSGTWNVGTVTTLPALPANQSVNVAQINGVATTMGNGVSGTGVQRVTIASDSTGTVAATQATAANLNVRPDTSGATGAAPPARANYVGGLASGATGGFVSGFAVCDSFANISVSTATTTLLVTGVSGRHVRICGLSLVTAGANNVALLSGTGATCGTGTTGMTGGTTASTGYNFAANSGISHGTGLGAINQTNATGDSVCIATSAATQLSGRLSYAIY